MHKRIFGSFFLIGNLANRLPFRYNKNEEGDFFMKKVFKIFMQIILALLVVILVLTFLAFSAKSEIVPDIYATSDEGKIAMAIRGGYKWTSFSESVIVDSVSPEDYVYGNDNILLVNPGERITLNNSDNPLERYKFYQLEMKYYDLSDNEFFVPTVQNSQTYAGADYLEVYAPQNEGTYIYNFKLSYYNKGEVSYGLKVVVSTEPSYDIDELIKYKDTKMKDTEKINEILNVLPYSKYKKGIILKFESPHNELIVNYDEFAMDRADLINNVIALFTLVQDLDVITYKSATEIFYFTRMEIENKVGRALSDYAENIELWKKEILFKEKIDDEKSSRDSIYKSIIKDIISEQGLDEIKNIFIDTQSFKNTEFLEVSDVDANEILDYALEFSNIVYDVKYEENMRLGYNDLYISLISMKDKVTAITETYSGDDIISGEQISNKIDYDLYKDIYVVELIVLLKNEKTIYKYEINYNNAKWNIMEL